MKTQLKRDDSGYIYFEGKPELYGKYTLEQYSYEVEGFRDDGKAICMRNDGATTYFRIDIK